MKTQRHTTFRNRQAWTPTDCFIMYFHWVWEKILVTVQEPTLPTIVLGQKTENSWFNTESAENTTITCFHSSWHKEAQSPSGLPNLGNSLRDHCGVQKECRAVLWLLVPCTMRSSTTKSLQRGRRKSVTLHQPI